MCSDRKDRIAQIRAEIDEVAAAARAATGTRGDVPDLSGLAGRLARIWAMLAEVDPVLAARLRTYCPDFPLDDQDIRDPGGPSNS
jgi:hypothetical protein